MIMEATSKTQNDVQVTEPVYEEGRAMRLAGLSERMVGNSPQGIPDQWQRFGPYIGHLPAQAGPLCYGVVLSGGLGGDMDYMCAVEVNSFAGLPPELRQLELAPQRYAVFRHSGHVSGASATWSAIVNGWLPQSSVAPVEAPWLERYGPEFDARTGLGGLDLMVPVARG
jgi:AraC family transcriptional regulator